MYLKFKFKIKKPNLIKFIEIFNNNKVYINEKNEDPLNKLAELLGEKRIGYEIYNDDKHIEVDIRTSIDNIEKNDDIFKNLLSEDGYHNIRKFGR